MMLFVISSLTLLSQPPVDLGWMSGHWANEDDGTLIEEIWTDDAGGLMLGVNRTIAGDQARAFEFLRIHLGEQVQYCAQPGGTQPVCFEMTSSDDQSVVFENAENDFPQRIAYEREGDEMTATISDPGLSNQMSWSWTLVPDSE